MKTYKNNIHLCIVFNRCECHGHGDTCNPLNGENCNCQNNTENDRQCSQKTTKNIMHLTPCWQLQVNIFSNNLFYFKLIIKM